MKKPKTFAIKGEKHHLIAIWQDLKKQGWETAKNGISEQNMDNHFRWFYSVKYITSYSFYDKAAKYELIPSTDVCGERNKTFKLPEQWEEALEFTQEQMDLYKKLENKKDKNDKIRKAIEEIKELYNVKNPDIMQGLYGYFYDNHDVMLLDSDFNEINRIINR